MIKRFLLPLLLLVGLGWGQAQAACDGQFPTSVVCASPSGGSGLMKGRALVNGDLPSGIDAAKIGGGSVSTTEFNRLDGITAYGQSIISVANEAALKALINAEAGVDFQAYDPDLTTYAGITPSANVQAILAAADYTAISALLEASMEPAIDTLANLTSIQGLTVTLADAGADAFFAWDDSANAYQNISAADARAAIGDIALTTNTSGNYVATVADGTGIDGTASGEGATYTPTLDLTEISTATFGAGAFTTLTFDAGATDPTFTFGSNSIAITNASTFTLGGSAVLTAATGQPLDADLTAFAGNAYAANATLASYIDLWEDTDNGSNRVRLSGAQSTADVTVTLPAATDTLVGKATTDVFTNKTLDCGGTGNVCTVRIGSDVSGLGTGVATFLGTPSTANLAAAVTGETGTGALVFGTAPQIDSIELNNATANTLTGSGGHITIEGQTVWDSGNDGSGSTLDADLLDGKNTGTSGNTIPLLDGANTWSGLQAYSASIVNGHTAKLTLGGAVAGSFEQFGTTAATATMTLGDFDTTDANTSEFQFYKSGNASIGSATVVASGEALGKLTWYGAQQTGTLATVSPAAQIRSEVDGTVTSGGTGDMPGRLVFATTPDASGTLTDRLILDAAGVLKPNANDGVALGTTSLSFSDLFLASGGVLNWNNGNATITHSAGLLTSNVAFSVGTSLAITAGTLEVGAATDTTVARGSAGHLSVEGATVWDSGNDGSGSTLDADLLDGISSAAFHQLASNTATFGNGTFTTLTFDAGATDPTFTFGSNSLAITNAATFTVGGSAVLTAATGQPLDSDLTAIAALTTTAAGRSVLTITDPNADRVMAWDDSAGAIAPIALTDITTEASPVTGDYLLIYKSTGGLEKVNWSSLPGASAGIANVVEDTTPQLGGDLDTNGHAITANNLLTIDLGSADWGTLKVRSTAATDASPVISTFADSASPAVNDAVGFFNMLGRDSGGNETEYAGTAAFIVDPTNGSEDGAINLFWLVGGATGTGVAGEGTSFRPTTNDSVSLGKAGTAWSDLYLANGGIIDWNNGAATITHDKFLSYWAGLYHDVTVDLGSTDWPAFVVRGTASNDTAPTISIFTDSSSPAANDFIGGINLDGRDTAGNYQDYGGISGYLIDPTDGSEDASFNFVWITGGATTYVSFVGNTVVPYTNDGLSLGQPTVSWSDLYLAEGGVINWDNGDATITQTNNDITVAGITTFGLGTSTALTTGTIELGAASDTTVTRGSAGHLSVEGQTIWDAANDGTGSTLDADLLDGKNTGTSGNTIPLLDGSNAWSGLQTFSASMVLGDTAKRTLGNAVAGSFEQFGTDTATGTHVLGMFNATAGTQADLQLYRSKNAAVNTATVVASGDGLGKITWYGAQQTGTLATVSSAAQIRAEVDGTVTSGASGDMPGRLVFSTTPDASGTLTDRLILDATGALKPSTNDGVSLGLSGAAFADLWLASGGLIEMDGGTSNTLTCTSGSCSIEGNTMYRAGGTDVPVGDGGTGISSGTSGGVPYFSSSSTIASSAALASGSIVVGGGAGAAPSTITLGGDCTLSGSTITCKPTEAFCVAASDETTALTTGTAKVTFRMPYAFTVTDLRASVNTVSSSGNPTFDIKEGGTTIMGANKLSIDSSEKTSTTAATAYSSSDNSLADDAEMTIDISTAGTGAKGAKICIIGKRT